ncbi:MAG TPA: prepilin-type N-terminal cleavage/methylation domain-containing protein [Gemmataceae bacterium]|nr:prepilin-type N-terminal cleavage/methylation domain-containing protein [Gemmataceae bacterium]
MTTRRMNRPAYTLLEVLLAMAIGVLLLAAVYVALDVQFHAAQAGRDLVEQSTLARALLNRLSNDISQSLGTIDPSRYRPSGQQSGSTGQTTPAPSSGGSGATGSGGTGSPASDGSSDAAAATSQVIDPTGAVTFNLFVQGDATTLTLYISRLPRELNALLGAESMPVLSDLRRVTWWLAGNPDAPLGLARQEVKVATSDDALGPPVPEGADEAFLIAEEVKYLRFSYFDGTAWQESWNGAQMGSDGRTPIGPPLAIAIEIGIIPPGSRDRPSDETALQKYRHVVAIPTANGVTQQSSP